MKYITMSLLLVSTILLADNKSVYEIVANEPIVIVYPKLLEALNNNEFIVIHSIDIGENLERYGGKWGGLNTNNISGIKALMVCNLRFSYELRNADPKMLTLCPMHLSLYERESKTHILLQLPSYISKGSPANELAVRTENKLIQIIQAEITK